MRTIISKQKKRYLIWYIAVPFLLLGSLVSGQTPHFTRIDTGALVDEVIRGRGLYVVDYDMDGLPDLYVGNSTGTGDYGCGSGFNRPNLLFRNLGNGRFIGIKDSLIASTIYKHNSGSNWGDLDNDGDPDMYNDGELFINDGSGAFYPGRKVTDRNEVNAIWIDLNNDGFLDILTNVYFGGNYAYLNQRDGTFRETDAGDFNKKGVGGSQSFSMADADNDGDMDVFEANLCLFGACKPLVPNTLYINNNDGTFSSLDSSSALVSEVMVTPGSSWGDYDNDGDMDIYVLSMANKTDALYRNDGNLQFTKIVLDPGEAGNKMSYSSSWGDLNNDGYIDLFVSVVPEGNVISQNYTWFDNMLYMNNGDGTFRRVITGAVISDGGEPHVMDDFDNDGDLDILIGHGNGSPPCLIYTYLNDGNGKHWLNLSCEGTLSNRSAIGTRVRVKADVDGKPVWMMREISQENGVHSCNGPRLHFGLGQAVQADSIIIRWPSGHIDTYTDIPSNHFYKTVENKSFGKYLMTDL